MAFIEYGETLYGRHIPFSRGRVYAITYLLDNTALNLSVFVNIRSRQPPTITEATSPTSGACTGANTRGTVLRAIREGPSKEAQVACLFTTYFQVNNHVKQGPEYPEVCEASLDGYTVSVERGYRVHVGAGAGCKSVATRRLMHLQTP